MKLVEPVVQDGQTIGWAFACGCPVGHHIVYVRGSGRHAEWEFDGNEQVPTFSPSVLSTYPWGPERTEVRCHIFVRAGHITYLDDCTFDLAGQTLPMEPFTWDCVR